MLVINIEWFYKKTSIEKTLIFIVFSITLVLVSGTSSAKATSKEDTVTGTF
ncbi:hypothetical protein [Clostridium gasigenes]|uniref:Uncharacterized protein n=1 Tax=Clostridium gasigenes TaxID=94869 RepID=A0A1H0ULQ5_9CLOT|nr:hypothetical protein [Clostridium gasigenes]MBB6623142.1 hypothetical protein [Clostridium gasigenes]SDP67003.1 hypothetical protein SAMN04488529_11171 [Clostridium gasigenes]